MPTGRGASIEKNERSVEPAVNGARFAFLNDLDEAAIVELLTALEDDAGLRELHRAAAIRHEELAPPPAPVIVRDLSPVFAPIGDQLIDAHYGVAFDAARKCVGVYHRMGLIPTPETVEAQLTRDQRTFLSERENQGCSDRLLIVPRLDDRVVPLSLLLDGYTELRRSISAGQEAPATPQRTVPVEEKQYVVEKGLWNRANFNQSHNPEYSTTGDKEPVWKVVVLLGDVVDPFDSSKPAHSAGERGLVHNLVDPRAIKRAFADEKLALAQRNIILGELSVAGYVLANTIFSMLGEQPLDSANNSATLFTYYRSLRKEAGADLYPVVYTRNGRIYLDETPATSRSRVRPVGVRRVIEII
jgi:hypothetical protein